MYNEALLGDKKKQRADIISDRDHTANQRAELKKPELQWRDSIRVKFANGQN